MITSDKNGNFQRERAQPFLIEEYDSSKKHTYRSWK